MDVTAAVLLAVANVSAAAVARWLLVATPVVISVAAVLVARSALKSQREFRTRDELGQLLAYFDASGFWLRMWQLDKVTRGNGDPASINPCEIKSLWHEPRPAVEKLCREAFGYGVEVDRADMYAVYFFALRVRAWLVTSKGLRPPMVIRLLNDTFGWQLLGTFLNQRIVACRLSHPDKAAGYYPTHYGLFEDAYTDIVNRLAEDLLRAKRLQPAVCEPLTRKRTAVDGHLRGIAPLITLNDPPEFTDSRGLN